MRKINLRIMLTFAVLLFCTACGKSEEERIAEQLELGNRYLEEMDYEQAIMAFNKVIEIDAKQAQAYTGLLKAYLGENQSENAELIVEKGIETFSSNENSDQENIREFFKTIEKYYAQLGNEEELYSYWEQMAAKYSENEYYQQKLEKEREPLMASSVKLEKDYKVAENGTYEYAIITGYDEQGNVLWVYYANDVMATELSAFNEIGIVEELYIFNDGWAITALDMSSGAVRWRNTDFKGSVSGAEIDGQNIYVCGYYGPDFFMLNTDGVTIHQIESFDDKYYWPIDIYQENDTVKVVMSGETEVGEECIFNVNLFDFSYKIENLAGNADIVTLIGGSDVILQGVLTQDESGNPILRLNLPVQFIGDELTGTFSEIGLTGTNDKVELEEIVGKHITTYGNIFEAHSPYHFSPVMLLDGYTNLELLE